MIQEDVDNLTNVIFIFILTARSVVITTMIIHNYIKYLNVVSTVAACCCGNSYYHGNNI